MPVLPDTNWPRPEVLYVKEVKRRNDKIWLKKNKKILQGIGIKDKKRKEKRRWKEKERNTETETKSKNKNETEKWKRNRIRE